MQPLTDAQRQLAEENHDLIYKFLHQNRLDIDEWYGIVAIDYTNAARVYDPSKGFKFSTLAYCSMKKAVAREYERRSRVKRTGSNVSLDETLLDGDSSWHDYLQSPVSLEDDTIFRVDAECSLKLLSQNQIMMLRLAASGLKQSEIGAILGISQVQVSRLITHARAVIFTNLPLPKRKRPAEVRTPQSA